MAIKLHFDEGSYDAFKFNFKGPRLKETTFLARRDRYFFEKIAKRHSKRESLIEYFLANVLAGHDWIGSMNDAAHLDWCARMQRLSYSFKSELSTLCNSVDGRFDKLFEIQGSQCQLYESYHRGEVSLETLAILDILCNYTGRISKHEFDPLGTLKAVSQRVKQYKPFMVQRLGDKKIFRELVIKTFTSP